MRSSFSNRGPVRPTRGLPTFAPGRTQSSLELKFYYVGAILGQMIMIVIIICTLCQVAQIFEIGGARACGHEGPHKVRETRPHVVTKVHIRKLVSLVTIISV